MIIKTKRHTDRKKNQIKIILLKAKQAKGKNYIHIFFVFYLYK